MMHVQPMGVCRLAAMVTKHSLEMVVAIFTDSGIRHFDYFELSVAGCCQRQDKSTVTKAYAKKKLLPGNHGATKARGNRGFLVLV